jgi:bifunctional oligoribonuclease and PAP phosphatase NrnA
MALDWSPFVAFVNRHERFLVTTHTRPDGDALGSQLAVAEALESLGKKAVRVIPSRLPPRYEFLDPNRHIMAYGGPTDYLRQCDAILVVDTGTWNQLAGVADFIRGSSAEKFVIDHHQTQDELGGGRFVDTNSESCGRLTWEAICALGVVVTPTMANYLFMAVATDTGWFRHTNTSAATMTLAAELISCGAKPTELYEWIYETNTKPRLALRGRSLSRLATSDNDRVAWSEIYAKDYADTGAIPLDTEDLINDPRSLAGNIIALLFIEQPDGQIKISFRSKEPVDVAKLAEQFGGGGHKRAAGATLPGPLPAARDKVLAAAHAVLPNEVRRASKGE